MTVSTNFGNISPAQSPAPQTMATEDVAAAMATPTSTSVMRGRSNLLMDLANVGWQFC